MSKKNGNNNSKAKGDVHFREPAAKLVAKRPNDDQELEQLEQRLSDGEGFPGSCGGL